MKTITKQHTVSETIGDDPKHALKWLKDEYPNGVDLTYVDYHDSIEDADTLQKILKGDDSDIFDWYSDEKDDNICEVFNRYQTENKLDELSDNIEDVMRNWLYEHDTSDPLRDLLRHTGRKLFFIETPETSEQGDNRSRSSLIKKYGKTDEQEKDIRYVLNEQFYSAPVSFYFYADVEEVYDAVVLGKQSRYISVTGAYFSTIDRVQGSNWLGNKACFNLLIPTEDFIKNVYLDDAKGNGYGWRSIAGQTDYEEATIAKEDKNTRWKKYIVLKSETSPTLQREKELQEHWDKTKTCTFGDMNWNRHKGDKPYSNNYPCGSKCETCGTFWID